MGQNRGLGGLGDRKVPFAASPVKFSNFWNVAQFEPHCEHSRQSLVDKFGAERERFREVAAHHMHLL